MLSNEELRVTLSFIREGAQTVNASQRRSTKVNGSQRQLSSITRGGKSPVRFNMSN